MSSEQRNLSGIYHDNPGITQRDIAMIQQGNQIEANDPSKVLTSKSGIKYVLVDQVPVAADHAEARGWSAQAQLNADLGYDGINVPDAPQISRGTPVSAIQDAIGKLTGANATSAASPSAITTALLIGGGLVILYLLLRR
jgi:hypothetical protein